MTRLSGTGYALTSVASGRDQSLTKIRGRRDGGGLFGWAPPANHVAANVGQGLELVARRQTRRGRRARRRGGPRWFPGCGDLGSGVLRVFDVPASVGTWMTFVPNSRRLVVSGAGELRLIDLGTAPRKCFKKRALTIPRVPTATK